MLGGGWDILLASLNVLGLLLTASYSVRFASLVFISPTRRTRYKNEVREKPSTYLPMTVITLLRVFLGSSLLWLIPAQAHPQLPGILTLLPLSIVLVGAITSFIIISSDRYVLSRVTLHTSRSMWYLPQLTTRLRVGWAIKSSASVLNLLDLGWVETTSLSTSRLSAGYESYHVVSLTSISPTNIVLRVTIPICLILLYL
jgi:NADH:ubiquinone oxidoreductase subunit 5 (subunit L)/multisubunit Na+/H+ antiporter MnhA subunit